VEGFEVERHGSKLEIKNQKLKITLVCRCCLPMLFADVVCRCCLPMLFADVGLLTNIIVSIHISQANNNGSRFYSIFHAYFNTIS
jgi:hypothetical protein